MDAKTFAWLVYLCVMMITGAVMGSYGLTINKWQYWVLLIGYVVVYLCGMVRGG